ncbi:hypothetical protein LDENG_00236200 [Xyrichtys novacula]|uniref:Fork-head domain-containing protein n=1 Tax=Xyrichtys novacula TaxID=13765 RepID=A0AAV1F5Y4_XYRNO|nr:hypothetical protein LDENG_00236200 [Xyrichtys novacula]
MASSVNSVKTTLTDPDDSSDGTHLLSKPALSYVALIAKVILASPSKKLNLSSIYRAMDEQFPHLKSRGPGWRNSVRHNLSVNECFVKVNRCEDGRGHYWGIHHAYLRDFQQGRFKLKARRRREKEREQERCDKAVRCVAWMESLVGRFCESRSLGWVEPQCPLQEPIRYQIYSWDWIQTRFQPLSVDVGWIQSARIKLPDFHRTATAVRGHSSQTTTFRPLHCREMTDRVLTGMTESYDGRFVTPPLQAFVLPGCWCLSPEKPLPYRI